jgi:V8-like Glu-specific endopeptidase
MRQSWLWLALCFVSACMNTSGAPEATNAKPAKTEEASKPVVYGDDDRQDVYASTDETLRDRALFSTVALMFSQDLDTRDPQNVKLNTLTLKEYNNLCEGQRFLTDPTAAFCSGTLIGDDLVLTAGHCVRSQDSCASARFVFNYLYSEAGKPVRITTDDIFTCKKLIKSIADEVDYSIIQLDRSAAPRFKPAPLVADDAPLSAADGVAVIGSGSGIPFKIDAGGKVRDPRAGQRDFFVATTDTFGGNSGSGVYRMSDYSLIGVLVRGEKDYVSSGTCTVVNTCEEGTCRGEDSTYAWNAVLGSCKTDTPLNPAACPPPPVVLQEGTIEFAVGNTQGGTRNTKDLTLSLEAGRTLAVGTCTLDGASGTGDTIIRLEDKIGEERTANDDTCDGLSYFEYDVVETGDYTIRIGCYSSSECSGIAVYQVW